MTLLRPWETWAKRVERWTDSGLTAKEYAAGLGIKAHSLTWWKWRLSSGAGSEGQSAQAALREEVGTGGG
jgi:hypothetical protein